MKILIIEDELLWRTTLSRQLSAKHKVFQATSKEEAHDFLQREVIDLAFVDLQLTENDDAKNPSGLQLIRKIHLERPETLIVAITGLEDSRLIKLCFENGASDLVFKPIEASKVELIVERASLLHRLIRQNRTLRAKVGTESIEKVELKTKSPKFKQVLDKLQKLRGTDASVLLRGESGVGKDVVAKYLWSLEEDESRPFIVVNCPAIPVQMAESELFGHKKGAFTGATENRIGKFEDADGGDIFLDEVATLSMEVQQKLLRTLNDGSITPLGVNCGKKIQCRVIAATNENIEHLIKEKSFREDLFFRLKQITIVVPPLRERKEDIADLTEKFLTRKHPGKTLSKEALDFCMEYHWPGNVRELKSAVEAAAIFSESDTISIDELRMNLESDLLDSQAETIQKEKFAVEVVNGNFKRLVRSREQELVRLSLREANGSISAAARLLGLHRNTLDSMVKRWGWETKHEA